MSFLDISSCKNSSSNSLFKELGHLPQLRILWVSVWDLWLFKDTIICEMSGRNSDQPPRVLCSETQQSSSRLWLGNNTRLELCPPHNHNPQDIHTVNHGEAVYNTSNNAIRTFSYESYIYISHSSSTNDFVLIDGLMLVFFVYYQGIYSNC